MVLIGLLLTGCVPQEEEGRTKIVFSIYGSLEQAKREQVLVDAFESANPDIEVELLSITAGRYAEKLQSMFVGRVAPDVLMIEFLYYHDWAARGVLLDVSEQAAEIQAEDPFMPLVAQAFQHRERYFALPINFPAYITYVNVDALKQAGIDIPAEGLTWSLIEEIAPRLSRAAGDPYAPTDYAVLMPDYVAPLWSFGARLFDDVKNPTKVVINSPETAAFITFMRELNAAPWSVPPSVRGLHGMYQLFRDGKTALFIGGRWETPNFTGKTNFKWDILPFPAGPAGSRPLHHGTGIAVAKDTLHAEAARRFVAFYASSEAARISMHGGRTVPAYRHLLESEEFLSLPPAGSTRNLGKSMELGSSEFFVYGPGARSIRIILERRLEQAIEVERDRPVEEIISLLETDLERWLAEYKRRYDS